MGKFRLSHLAEIDLSDIGSYTIGRWGEVRAARYLSQLEDCCQRLADNPGLGRSCDEVRPGLRRMEKGRHVLFYRQEPGGVLISRILHRRMLPAKRIHGDDDE